MRLETGIGTVPVEVEPRGERAGFGRMQQAIPSWAAFDREVELLGRARSRASGLPVEAYENGPLPRLRRARERGGGRGAPPRHDGPGRAGEIGANCFAGSGCAGRPGCSPPPTASPRTRPPAPPPGPLAVHLCRHGRVPFGEEIEISQGVELGRPSTLLARAERQRRAGRAGRGRGRRGDRRRRPLQSLIRGNGRP